MKKLSYKQLQKLFLKVKQGDNQAFKELYESSYQSQYFIAYNYINDQHLAEEAVQNMYINFYNHINSINNSMGIIKWMNTTTINECRKLIRNKETNGKIDIENLEDQLIDTKPSPEESYKQQEDKDNLNKALNKMEPELKEVIIYRFVDNLKVKEIAKVTNLSTATVNRYIKAGTMKLRKLLKNINNNLYSIALSPFMFKLFSNAMNAQASDKRIAESFNSSFSALSLTAAAGSTAAAVGAIGSNVAANTAKKTASIAANTVKETAGVAAKTIGSGAIAATTTAAVVVAAVAPTFQVYKINSDGYLLNQRLLVTSNNYDQISNISCYKDDSLIGELNLENEYTIEIYDNGTYTISVKDNAGIVHKKEVEITNVDYSCPDIGVSLDGDNFVATISDTGSGVDFDSLKIVNEANENVPYSINGNNVTFSSASPSTTISIADNLGNTKRLVLKNN